MTPIQTTFNDRRYRSRLEARYAYLLHSCALEFQYEREGFDLPVKRYLPDFWLPTLGIWFEVKGWTPSQLEQDLCQSLANETGRRVAVACGDPGMGTIVTCFMPHADGVLIQMLSEFLMQWVRPEIVLEAMPLAQSARFEFGKRRTLFPSRSTRSHEEGLLLRRWDAGWHRSIPAFCRLPLSGSGI